MGFWGSGLGRVLDFGAPEYANRTPELYSGSKPALNLQLGPNCQDEHTEHYRAIAALQMLQHLFLKPRAPNPQPPVLCIPGSELVETTFEDDTNWHAQWSGDLRHVLAQK